MKSKHHLEYIKIIYQTTPFELVEECLSLIGGGRSQSVSNLVQHEGFEITYQIVHIGARHILWQLVLDPFDCASHIVQGCVQKTHTDAL